MPTSGFRVALLGATGSVGGEILDVLEERSFPVRSLRAFASEDSEGLEVDFRGETIAVEILTPAALAGSDLVFSAAPFALVDVLDDLRDGQTRVIDVSGTLELDPSVPLYLPGDLPRGVSPGEGSRWMAIPRGCVGGLALSLNPLVGEVGLERVTVLVLESASGAGRRGVRELSDQTVNLLNAMSGEEEGSDVFPRALAFDCLPLVGDALKEGDSSEERRLVQVLRRLLSQPNLPVDVTRVRVPVFGGSMACVHLALAGELPVDAACGLWEKLPQIEVLPRDELPSLRRVIGRDSVHLGRIRLSSEEPRRLSFVLAMDDLRYGSALAAVLAAETLCRIH
jgi:aspartate-semialdehyde dehydrogenase